MKAPKRVRFDLRVLVARLTMFGPRGARFKPYNPRHPDVWYGHNGRPVVAEWMRVVPDNLRIGHPHAFTAAADCWRHRTFVRAVEQGLVHAHPNREATDPINGGFFTLTVDSRVRLSLTELGRAAYAVWCMQNASFDDINASG